MRLNILQLGSVVPEGVGGAGAGAINLIYSFLLQEYKCDVYSYIYINQIGDELEEIIIKDGKGININIRYPNKDFDSKSLDEKNIIRLDVVHTALFRIAEKERKLDINCLEKIRDRILLQDFEFELLYKQYEDKKNQLVGKILIQPYQHKFCFYFSTEKNGEQISKILVYEGKCTEYYIRDIFYTGNWVNTKEFVIKDKNKEIEIHVLIEENKVELINLTKYKYPPFFEIMKAGETSEATHKNWLDSLPPGTADFIKENQGW